MNEQDTFIDSSNRVLKNLEKWDQRYTNLKEICSVMKEDMCMRYRKVVPISIRTNSEKNLVCRQ